MSPKVFIKTFGCQMNVYDSDKMADVLHQAQGYEQTTDINQADLIMVLSEGIGSMISDQEGHIFSDSFSLPKFRNVLRLGGKANAKWSLGGVSSHASQNVRIKSKL